MKFGRRYELTIQGSGVTNTIQGPVSQNHVVSYPLTLEFDINRNTLASVNTGHFKIYNLKESTRADIYQDRRDLRIYRKVILKAGYASEPNLPVIFQGNIVTARSYRQAPAGWITEIDCYDGGFGVANSQINLTKPAGWNFQDVARGILSSMQNVSIGTITDAPAPNSRGISFSGNSWDALQQLNPDGDVFIDNEVAHILNPDEYILSDIGIPVITSETGLLNTPQRQLATVIASMIFEPRIVVGQRVFLQSKESVNNGYYKVSGIHHRGTISGAVSGDALTDLTLWSGQAALTGVPS